MMVRSLRIGHRRFVLGPGVNTIGREPQLHGLHQRRERVARPRAHHRRQAIRRRSRICKSKNGTQVMGETIKGPTMLKDGDEVEFGHVKGWFIVEAADDPPTTTHL